MKTHGFVMQSVAGSHNCKHHPINDLLLSMLLLFTGADADSSGVFSCSHRFGPKQDMKE